MPQSTLTQLESKQARIQAVHVQPGYSYDHQTQHVVRILEATKKVGELTVEAGAVVSNAEGTIGYFLGSSGVLTVTGAGSVWNNSDELNIGYSGAGTLTISNGGAVLAASANISYDTAASGDVTITGTGSIWSVTDYVSVGAEGTGTLAIADGGTVATSLGYIGYASTADGTARVSDDGSTWTLSDWLYVGLLGAGALTVESGATVSAPGVTIAYDLAATGTVRLEGSNATGRGVLETAFVERGDGDASLVFNGGILRATGHETDFLSGFNSGDVTIDAGGALIDTAGFNVGITTDLSGNGGLRKLGAGTLTLSGISSFTGSTSMEGGHLAVNGSLGGVLNVVAGRLSGSGTVGMLNLGSGATIAPGNSIGTLTVGGDLVFDAGTIYEVEVDPNGTVSDLIDVSGVAFLNDASVAHIGISGNYRPLSTYTIVTAGGGINGTFGAVTSAYAFLVPELSYDTNNVYLQIGRNHLGFRDLAVTPNQVATAKAAEQLLAGHAVHDAILTLPDVGALIQASYDALSGEIHASAKSALIADSVFVRDVVSQRLRPGSVASDVPAPWGAAFGNWSSANGDGNAATLSHRTGGLFAGLDSSLDDWRVGLLAGFSNTGMVIDDRASSGSSDNYYLGIYGGTEAGNLSFRTGLARTWHDVEARRAVAVGSYEDSLAAHYGASTFQAFGEAGYQLETPLVSLEPFANFAHVRHLTDGFAELGGAAALVATPGTTIANFTTIGLRANADVELGQVSFNLRGMIGWQHTLDDVAPMSTHAFGNGDAFTIAGAPLARNAFVLEAGMDFDLTDYAAVNFDYAGQIGNGTERHSLKATLQARF